MIGAAGGENENQPDISHLPAASDSAPAGADVTASDDASEAEPERKVEPLLEPRDGLPPLVTTAAALQAAVERLAAGTGPIAVDAYGKFLYVVNTGSDNVSGFVIAANTGVLTAFTGGPVVAGAGANSIAIRSDDSWVFVANTNATSVSQYAITLTTGALNPLTPISTLDFPSGVAVK